MPESIVVIGCGPGGMFFCHALETKRREMLERGESVDNLPKVTVFEQAGSPGGVWRSNRNHDSTEVETGEEKKESSASDLMGHNTQMYEALWTNGPKEGIEFHDYTYDEHFRRQLPVYMPRQAMLEYMLARVVKNCPSFFEKYVQFYTSVRSVVYNEDDEKFHVTTHNILTGNESTTLFDKCIWAAGADGKPHMPKALLRRLDGFQGRVIHSTDTANFQDDVRGKRILIVGGAFSAEDLALMACKVGVEQVYISSRSEENIVSWMGAWPGNKVECLLEYGLSSVENGSTVVLQKTKCIVDEQYEFAEDEEPHVLEGIDTIVLCTGYAEMFDMLEPKLRRGADESNMFSTFPVPDDWKMAENRLTKHMGDVPVPKEARWYGTMVEYPDLYRGVLIDNPNMMILRNVHDEYPLLAIEGIAWLFMQYTTGGVELPSPEEMRRQNIEQGLFEMKHYPFCRIDMDLAYREKWTEEIDPEWEEHDRAEEEYSKYELMAMARTMQEAKHPTSLGTYEGLNRNGRKLYKYASMSYTHRTKATDATTYRDVENAHKFKSLYTGTEAIPLKKLWMDIDESVDKCIV